MQYLDLKIKKSLKQFYNLPQILIWDIQTKFGSRC